jgi:hypothetical protein
VNIPGATTVVEHPMANAANAHDATQLKIRSLLMVPPVTKML